MCTRKIKIPGRIITATAMPRCPRYTLKKEDGSNLCKQLNQRSKLFPFVLQKVLQYNFSASFLVRQSVIRKYLLTLSPLFISEVQTLSPSHAELPQRNATNDADSRCYA